MPCIAVTRGGLGDVWLFDSLLKADEHAIVQFGDALCETEDRVTRIWSSLELIHLAKVFGDEKLAKEMDGKKKLNEYTGRIWNLLVSVAKRPPIDPAEVLRLVAEDRKATRMTGLIQRPHPNEGSARMADETEKPKKEKKAKGEGPGKRQPKFAGTSVISFGHDAKADKDYGPQADGSFHNAKKAGSGAATRFAKLKSGMTIDEALAAGVTRGDINWDVGQGFIKLT